ncbi:hypothetical protein G6F56_007422 [Rhizopus delemar]|nr:hypothetical protein G6F56_007422 [Rhizopus delemar]
MKLPNLFTWISERYPLSSELITEKDMLLHDNLYLDVTSIIKNSLRPQFARTEKQVWDKITTTIGRIVSEIKPGKFLLLVVDGVTPRAVENVERTRGFSNTTEIWGQTGSLDPQCAFPGTQFMAKLSKQLKYFIAKKISEEAEWRNLEVVLSGPDVPGDGRQKIMDHIRFSRAQPGYNPNTRHCVYGIEDYHILLGLASHEPHMNLVCEEAAYQQPRLLLSGDKNFFSLRLSLVREYLDLEFAALKANLSFGYEFERILDDFVLICLLLRNNFLPRLPHVDDPVESLETLLCIYKDMMPTIDGYLNDSGSLSLERLEKLLGIMATTIERDIFEIEHTRSAYKALSFYETERLKSAQPTNMTENQAEIFGKIRDYLTGVTTSPYLRFSFPFKLEDRSFTNQLTRSLKISTFFSFSQAKQISELEISFLKNFMADQMDTESVKTSDVQDDTFKNERMSILSEYENLEVISAEDKEEIEQREKQKELDEGFEQWRDNYYKTKMNINIQDTRHLNHLVGTYIIGFRWVLQYYYTGIVSWSWFYPYHYAPMMSDIKCITPCEDYNFVLNQPLKPLEHLMFVLPKSSMELLPDAYQSLITDQYSSIREYYPTYFQKDGTGERSVTNIPFINSGQLLELLKTRESLLSPEEAELNHLGESQRFIYNPTETKITTCSFSNYTVKKGLLSGVKIGKDSLGGTPSLQHLNYDFEMAEHNVLVYGQGSENDSMLLSIENKFTGTSLVKMAQKLLFHHVYVGYPTMRKALVVGVSDKYAEYCVTEDRSVCARSFNPIESSNWNAEKDQLEAILSKRCGILTGSSDFMVSVCLLQELKESEEIYSPLSTSINVIAQTLVLNSPSFVIPPPAIPDIELEKSVSAWCTFAKAESTQSSGVGQSQTDLVF